MKRSGAVKICTDLKLNLEVKRERCMIPTFEDLLHKIKGATVFSKLDAIKRFWQIPLEVSTAQPMMFLTPISSAPVIF